MKFNISTNNINLDENIYFEIKKENEESSFKNRGEDGNFGKLESNYECNKFLYKQLDTNKPIYMLELGCGGGQFVADFIKDGHYAVGIDARPGYRNYVDYAPNWKKYPNNFLMCDLGKPFQILDELNNPVIFDIISSWECFEHIYSDDIDCLMKNIEKHSKINTYFIGSISFDPNEDVHRTIKSKNWWMTKFNNIGFIDTSINIEHIKIVNAPTSFFFFLKKVK